MKPSSLINKLGKENAADTNKALESIRKIGGNKSCFDCGEKGVTYVVPKFGVFVCSRCSGIHRELGFMVKGLGVSNFSEKEIAFLQEMGNDNAQKLWLAKLNTSKHSLPKSTDEVAVKEHIKSKYVDKKWYSIKGVEEKKEDKSKVEANDDSDLEEDLKPSQLKNKIKKPIIVAKDVSIKKDTKEKENKDNKYQEKVTPPVKLNKLNMSNNQTGVTGPSTGNGNVNSGNGSTSISNNQGWKPKFEENNRNSKVEENPFEFFGNKNNNVNVNSPFEFPNQPQDSNPFGWGTSSVSDNSGKTSTQQTSQVPVNTNKVPDDVFSFNFTNTSTSTNPISNQTNNTGYQSKNTISPNIDNSKQSNQFDFNFTGQSNNNNITSVPVNNQPKIEEKPKKNLDDIMNLLNNNNSMGQQIPINPINPSNINFNINNNLYNHSNYPTFPMGVNFNQIAQNPQMMMLLANFMQQNQGQLGQMGYNPNIPMQNPMQGGFDGGMNFGGGFGNGTPDLSGFSNLNIKESKVDIKPEVKEVSRNYYNIFTFYYLFFIFY